MEDLLPIIIGILWVAYTLYNRSQKKKRSEQSSSSEESNERKPSIIEQLLMGEDVSNSQPYEATEQFSESDYEEEVEVDKSFQASKKPSLQNELASFVQERGIAFNSEAETEGDIQLQPETEEVEFDLRKAIVYSEILNAPYIVYK